MEQSGRSFGSVEQEAMQRLEAELSHHAELTRLTFNAIGSALNRLPATSVAETPQTRKVVVALLIRLANDLRSAVLVALRGYPLQSSGPVAIERELCKVLAGAERTLSPR
jgi:hypothetical protein